MVRIDASDGNVAFDVVSDFILFDYCITVFDNQDALFGILVDFVALDCGERQFFNFYAGFPVETDQVVTD